MPYVDELTLPAVMLRFKPLLKLGPSPLATVAISVLAQLLAG